VKAIRKGDGLATGDEEVGKLMLDRECCRSRINVIAKENISYKSGRCRTKSDAAV
jgi:hypothetical protein